MILINESGDKVQFFDDDGSLISGDIFHLPIPQDKYRAYLKTLSKLPFNLRQDIGNLVENGLDVYAK